MKYLILINLLLVSFISNAQQKLKMHLDTVNVDGRAGVEITINEMPGQKFVLEIPEIFMVQEIRNGLYNYSKQVWDLEDDEAEMILTDGKYKHKISLKAVNTKNSIGLKWKINFKNNSDSSLYDLAAFNCWTFNTAPLFKDTKMERSYVNDASGNKKFLKDVDKTQGGGRRNMQFYPAVGGIDLSKSPWLAQWIVTSKEALSGDKVSLVSNDSKWLFENIVDGKVAFFFNNWEHDHGCLHASPLLSKELKPGKSATAKGIFKFTRL